MKEFLFPYEQVRPIQEALIKQVSSIIDNKYNLIAHAPTGIGKTAILGPALKQAINKDLTVFFLTPRHSQHHIAIETLKQIKEKYNLDFTAVDLIGKKHMCPVPGIEQMNSSEFADYCSGVKKVDVCEFYLNTKKKVKKQLAIKQIPDIAHVEELCKVTNEHKMCSFELACEKAKGAKVIIADYFHILAPIRDILLKRINKELEHSILIFDEAHNLPDRCRDVLTASLATITLDRAIRENIKFGFELKDDLENIKAKLHQIEFPLDKQEILVEKFELKVEDDLITKLKLAADDVLEEQKRSSIASVARFLELWKGPDEGFIRVISRKTTKKGKQFIHLTYKCLDPSFVFDELKPHSTILMSGTLSPTDMYQDLLDLNKDKTLLVEYKSPFPKKNRLNLIIPTTSTKYTARSEEMYEKIANTCANITNLIPGSIAIYFPSYKLRDEVNKYFQPKCNKTIFFEQSGLNKLQKQELIDKFKTYKEAVILGAASGSLGEGIDLPGLLKAVIIVGLPLGKPDLETQQLISYYQERFGKGWDYGYIYPAIIKSLQNAGRCIRSETDRGIIAFLDERYTWPNYQKCFPPDVKTETVIDPTEKIKEFFK